MLLLSTPYAFAQDDPPDKKPPNPQAGSRLEFKEHGFAIRLPNGWHRTKSSGASFLKTIGPAGDDRTIRLTVRSAADLTPAQIGSEGLVDQLRAQIKKAIASYEADGEGRVEIAGVQGLWLRGKVGTSRILQYVFASESKGFIATFTYPEDTEKKYLQSIARAVTSIELMSPEAASKVEARLQKGRILADHGFSIGMPWGWKLGDESVSALVAMRGPETAAINVQAEKSLKKFVDPEVLAEQITPSLQKVLGPEYKVLKARAVAVGRIHAIRIEAEFVQDDVKMRNIQLFIPGS